LFRSTGTDAGVNPPANAPKDPRACPETGYPGRGFAIFDPTDKVISPGDLVRLTVVGHNAISLKPGTPQVTRFEEADSGFASVLRAVLSVIGAAKVAGDPERRTDLDKQLALALDLIRKLEGKALETREFLELIASAPGRLADVRLADLADRYGALEFRNSGGALVGKLADRAKELTDALGDPDKCDETPSGPKPVCVSVVLAIAQRMIDEREITACRTDSNACEDFKKEILPQRTILGTLLKHTQVDPKAPTLAGVTLDRYLKALAAHRKNLDKADPSKRWENSFEVNVTAASVVPTKTERFFITVPFELAFGEPGRAASMRTLSLLVSPAQPPVIVSGGLLVMAPPFDFKKLAVVQIAEASLAPKLATADAESPRRLLPLILTSLRLNEEVFFSIGTSTDKDIFKTGVVGVSRNFAKHRAVVTIGFVFARGSSEFELANDVAAYGRFAGSLDLTKIPKTQSWHQRFFVGLSLTP
jgi:hypothetical protein